METLPNVLCRALSCGVLDIPTLLRLELAGARLPPDELAAALDAAAWDRHGCSLAGGDLATAKHALRELEAVGTMMARCFCAAEIERGAALTVTYVGSVPSLMGWAQLPPHQGDAWRLRFSLRKGQYWLRLIGGKNMHHGALTLELDGAPVARVDTYDQPNDLAAWWVPLEVPQTGEHVLRGQTLDKGENAYDFWQVLVTISCAPRSSRDAVDVIRAPPFQYESRRDRGLREDADERGDNVELADAAARMYDALSDEEYKQFRQIMRIYGPGPRRTQERR